MTLTITSAILYKRLVMRNREEKCIQVESKPRLIPLLLAVLVILFSFSIRVYKVGEIPAGFFCDEASIGYNAWAISHFGVDDSGASWPLYVKSFEVHKNPVFVYASMIPINLFGLSEFSTRFTSVIFGTLTVAGIIWLMAEIIGIYTGLLAGLLMAITPWNFHFSRIAFELISMPCCFVFGLVFMIRGVKKGRWNWIWAGILLALTIHSYVMAIVFVPFFLIVFGLLYFKELWRDRKFVIAACVVMLLLIAPAIHFRLSLRHSQHFQYTSWLSQQQHPSLNSIATEFWAHYKRYYSYDFLFKDGDISFRHSIRGHGELLKAFFPVILAGIIVSFIPPIRISFLLLTWLLLFPAGAAFTSELYATRSILGSPLGSIYMALGFSKLAHWLSQIKVVWLRKMLLCVYGFGLLGFLFQSGQEAVQYFKDYIHDYCQYSASGIYGFQYGYRELISFMESKKADFPQKLLTSTNVNVPEVFVNFYTKLDPRIWNETHQNGYKIIRAIEFSGYELNEPTIFALRENELYCFDDYEVLHRVIDPAGNTEFVIADVKRQKSLIVDWSMIGLFPYEIDSKLPLEYPAPVKTFQQERLGLSGMVRWEPFVTKYAMLEFQEFFVNSDPRHVPGNPELCYADGVTFVHFPEAMTCRLEFFGSDDLIVIWLNGQIIQEPIKVKDRLNIVQAEFQAGWNEITFRSFEEAGEWLLAVALTDLNGKSIPGLLVQAVPPGYSQQN